MPHPNLSVHPQCPPPQPQCPPQCPHTFSHSTYAIHALGSRLSDFPRSRHVFTAAMGAPSAGNTQRGPQADRPRSSSHHSARNASPHPPSSSRSRNRYPSLKMAPQPGHDSAPNTPSSPSVRYPHPTLDARSSQRKGSTGSLGGERPPTPISRSSAKDSQTSSQLGPQSTLLQEKLQRERRSEIQRGLTRLADDTPTRCATADGRRQDPDQEFGDGKHKGLALREMEQVLQIPVDQRDPSMFRGY